MSPAAKIRVLSSPIPKAELAEFVGNPFEGMVKFVVDLDERCIAIGGELHADAEALLLDCGSKQGSLWGGNYYPGVGEGECIQYSSRINIRPSQGNPAMVVQRPEIRARMRELVHALLGRGEALH